MSRVLLFAPLYPPYSGGSPTFFSELANTLPDEYDVHILTAYHQERPLFAEENGSHVYRIIPMKLDLPTPIRLILEGGIAFVAAMLIGLARRIDVAHVHSTSFSTPPIAVAMTILSVPYIYDCQDPDVRPWIATLGNPVAHFSIGERIDEILVDAGVDEDSIIRTPVTNPSYVSEYASRPSDSADDSFSVVFVGALRELKGVDILLDGFCEFAVDRPDATLTLMGDGSLRDQLDDRIRRSEIGDRIELLGNVPHRKALSEMASADVLALLSEREGRPRVVLEALAVGTPVVATRVGAIPNVIDHGENGLLVERSRESVVEALATLYEDPKQRQKMTENALDAKHGPTESELINAVERGYSQAKSV